MSNLLYKLSAFVSRFAFLESDVQNFNLVHDCFASLQDTVYTCKFTGRMFSSCREHIVKDKPLAWLFAYNIEDSYTA